MISHVSWYLLFVGWILLAQVNMIDVVTQGQIGADVYDYLAFVWAFGFTISDIQMVYQLSQVSELHVLIFAISWMHYIFSAFTWHSRSTAQSFLPSKYSISECKDEEGQLPGALHRQAEEGLLQRLHRLQDH